MSHPASVNKGRKVKAAVKYFTAESSGRPTQTYVLEFSIAFQLILIIITSQKSVPNERVTRAVYGR
jgi:hypothetical protein